MSISAEKVWFDADSMWLDLTDGRTMAIPLAWFPRLATASKDELETVVISPAGLHWETLDEDISVAGLIAGRPDQTVAGKIAV